MRALYILPAEGFGGAERQGLLHIANLSKAGVEVVAVTGPGQPIRTEIERAGIPNYVWYPKFPSIAVEARGFFAAAARPWRYLRSWWRATRDLSALARKERVDVIFASRTFGWIVGGTVGRHLGLPVVWRAGSMPTSKAERFMLRNFAPLIGPTALVANSETGRKTYSGLLRVPTAVLPNGVDTGRFNPDVPPRLRRELGFEHVPVIGLAARPAPEKGLAYLAEVAGMIAAVYPTARLLIAGEFPWREYYQRLFANLGLSQIVAFLGHIAEIEEFYASCDVIVLTSRQGSIEMSSNAILEAMSTGRAVVATNVGGLSEIIENGVNGYLVPADDPRQFAARVATLVDSPSLRCQLGVAARERILKHHSQEAVTESLAGILQAVGGPVWSAQRAAADGNKRKEGSVIINSTREAL